MKKILLAILTLTATALAWAQPSYSNLDTLSSLPSRYYAPEWYTKCHTFHDSANNVTTFFATPYITPEGIPNHSLIANEYSVNGRMEIRGLMCMVVIDFPYDTTLTSNLVLHRRPEKLYLFQGGALFPNTGRLFPRDMTLIDSLRWDHRTPYVLRLPRFDGAVDEADFITCYAYDVYFDTPVVVDSVFYIAGSRNSNTSRTPPEGVTAQYIAEYYPVVYRLITENADAGGYCDLCSTRDNRVFDCPEGFDSFSDEDWYFDWHLDNYYGDFFRQVSGPMFAIVDNHHLVLNSSDPEAGIVEGSGYYPHLSTAVATAVPLPGHEFMRWSDGNTDNPRSVEMLSDVRLVAVFR